MIETGAGQGEESKEKVIPDQVIELLSSLERHLRLRQFICLHSVTYVEVFFLYILKLGELDIHEPD